MTVIRASRPRRATPGVVRAADRHRSWARSSVADRRARCLAATENFQHGCRGGVHCGRAVHSTACHLRVNSREHGARARPSTQHAEQSHRPLLCERMAFESIIYGRKLAPRARGCGVGLRGKRISERQAPLGVHDMWGAFLGEGTGSF